MDGIVNLEAPRLDDLMHHWETRDHAACLSLSEFSCDYPGSIEPAKNFSSGNLFRLRRVSEKE